MRLFTKQTDSHLELKIGSLTPVSVHEIENRVIHFKYLDAGLCLFAF